jgi:hypothetical protein
VTTTVVVSYRPKPDLVQENQRLVEAVYAELAASGPAGFRYTTVRLDDGRFIHTAQIDGENPLPSSPAFAQFLAGIDDRCEPGEGPGAVGGNVVGTYPPG